jgi:hypothetical protein
MTYGSRDLDRAEQMDNRPQFIAIMTSYGQSFLMPDITIFKQNLEALDNLQSKWKLYHKVSSILCPRLFATLVYIVFVFF